MAMTEFAKSYHAKMFPGYESRFAVTDPEFIERFDNFAFDEVINQPGLELDERIRWMAILAALRGCQGIDEFRAMVPAAMNFGLTVRLVNSFWVETLEASTSASLERSVKSSPERVSA